MDLFWFELIFGSLIGQYSLTQMFVLYRMHSTEFYDSFFVINWIAQCSMLETISIRI